MVAACAHHPDMHTRAFIARHTSLTLPTPPAYPETKSFVQTGRARYGALSGAFEAVVELSPEQVQIVVTAVSGPRLATITWNAAGVDIDRTVLAPPGVPAERVAAMRAAFIATVKDPDFLSETRRINMEIQPLPHDVVARHVAAILDTAEPVLVRARELLGVANR